jgi:RNA polymerase sigma-70 factor (ECF subfamily)
MIEDRFLIWRFNRGDPAALCRIYERHRDGLLKVAAALLNDRSGVEDVIHDVFVDFAQSVGRFELHGSLKGYLSICVANRARDRNRMLRRRGSVNLDEALPQPPSTDQPEHAAISRELLARLDAAMAELPDEQREIIVLHVQSSINTAMSRYRYGIDKLRSIVDGELKP